MERKRFVQSCDWRRYWPEITAVGAAVVFALGIVAHAWFLPPTRAYLGFVQIDQPVYYACAREYFENGNGLFAANPYSSNPNAPRQYSHFYFLLVGWVWRLTGISFSVIDGGVRLLLGPTFLLMAARVFRIIHRWRAGANAMLALMLLGGGLAWLTAAFATGVNYLVGRLSDSKSGSFLDFLWFLFMSEFRTAEGGYGDWHVQLFRNLFYGPEVFYHFLFFGAVLQFLRSRWPLGCVMAFLAWWAHPYTGLELALVCMAWLVVEWWRGDGSACRPLFVLAAITALFGFYYGVWLPRDPEHRSVYEQMKAFPAVMLTSQIISAYGLLIPFSLLALLTPAFRAQWRRREVRFVVIWTVIALFLNYHDKIIPWVEAVQPLHFSHGYLYVPLAILATYGLRMFLSLKGLRQALQRLPLWSAILLLVHLPDNVIWATRSVILLPARSTVFAPPVQDMELLSALNEIPTRETILAASLPARFSVVAPLIPVLTHHRAVGAHVFNTPNAAATRKHLEEFRSSPTSATLRLLQATAVLTSLDYASKLLQTMPDTFETSEPVLSDLVLLKVVSDEVAKSSHSGLMHKTTRDGVAP